MSKDASRFERLAQEERVGFLAEMAGFLKNNRKWYLVPLLVVLLLLGVLIALGSTGAAPFIYTLF